MTENIFNGANPDGTPMTEPSFVAKRQRIPMFCSQVTLTDLRVSIQVLLEVIPYLFSLGFEFVLTGRMNQDACEV